MKKQAILIIAHKNLWTIKQILKTLDSIYFDFFIHLDIKSNIKVDELLWLTKKSTVKVLKCIDVNW